MIIVNWLFMLLIMHEIRLLFATLVRTSVVNFFSIYVLLRVNLYVLLNSIDVKAGSLGTNLSDNDHFILFQ